MYRGWAEEEADYCHIQEEKRKLNADEDLDAHDKEAEDTNDYEEPKPTKVSSQKPTTQKAARSAPISISDPKPSSPWVKTEFDSISNTLQSTAISSPKPPPQSVASPLVVSKSQAARALLEWFLEVLFPLGQKASTTTIRAIHRNLLLSPGSSTNSSADVPLWKGQPIQTNNIPSGGSPLQDDLP